MVVRAPSMRFGACVLLLVVGLTAVETNEDAKRLFDDLMITYNRLRRPATSAHAPLQVKLKLRLSQIIDVVRVSRCARVRRALQHEKTQIMTTIVWLKQEWYDYKLTWEPKHYGDIKILYVPAEMIWTPDIVLFNKWVRVARRQRCAVRTAATTSRSRPRRRSPRGASSSGSRPPSSSPCA